MIGVDSTIVITITGTIVIIIIFKDFERLYLKALNLFSLASFDKTGYKTVDKDITSIPTANIFNLLA
ncbi:hypothetical protein SDC9_179572 [bioreactor metagenome]|uniref:Uncharacterized protein n=1 Tax=bioreactor metagenome TaxID=1076179 RepID=A0A645H0U5_9ZZZZ